MSAMSAMSAVVVSGPKRAQRRRRPRRVGRVAIVTDSLGWLPPEVAARHGIRVVPLHVHIGDEQFTETVDITNREFYRRLRAGSPHPRTSQPAVGEFLAAYREAAQEAEGIVSIHASSKLSGTCNSAAVAAALLREERPDVTVETLDTLQIATAQGIVAIRSAQLAAGGASLPEIVTAARALLPKPRVLLTVETLEYLRRGGRIGRAQAFLGGLLHVQPILTVDQGEVAPLERVRTRRRALERLLELVEREARGRPLAHVGVGHAEAPEEGEALLEAVRQRFPVAGEVLFAEIGPVIGTYVGPGALAVTFHCE
ncbi:MAG TPA: DegV family protein [Chloroflexota bacterium]|nr:DegV family protein [Chloroflexota bacterium]